MKRFIKGIGLALCLTSFSIFALGSGSDSNSSTEKIEVDATNSGSDSSNSSGTSSNSSEKKEMKYEITDSKFEYYTNSIGSVEYFGIVEITNTGDTYIYLDTCTFDLEDNDGHLLQSDSYINTAPSVVAPGEKGYYYNGIGNGLIGEGVSLDNGVKLVPQLKISEAKKVPTEYPVSDVTTREGDFGYINVVGRVENTSDKDISYLYISIIFYDENGKVLDVESTGISDIAAGNKGSFDTTCFWSNDNVKFTDIAETKVYARELYINW